MHGIHGRKLQPLLCNQECNMEACCLSVIIMPRIRAKSGVVCLGRQLDVQVLQLDPKWVSLD